MAKDVCEAYLDAIFAAQQGPHDARLAGTAAGANKGGKSQGSPRPSKTGSFQEAKIEVFPFDPSGKGFGKGGAQIVEVKLLSETGEALSWTSGGELVTLIIRAQVSQDIHVRRRWMRASANVGRILRAAEVAHVPGESRRQRG